MLSVDFDRVGTFLGDRALHFGPFGWFVARFGAFCWVPGYIGEGGHALQGCQVDFGCAVIWTLLYQITASGVAAFG